MADAGINHYTFHIEATNDVNGCIRQIREAGMKVWLTPSFFFFCMSSLFHGIPKVGVGLKPNTPVSVIEPYLELIDTALIMTVEPGFGGQKFMHDMLAKVNKSLLKF